MDGTSSHVQHSGFSPFNDQAISPGLSRQQYLDSNGPSPPSLKQRGQSSIDGSDYNSPGSVFGTSTFNAANELDRNARGSVSKDDGTEITPAWAELKTKAGKDRKRLPLACITCRRKKIRCSGEKPACRHCLRSRIPCVYKVTTRKAAPRTDYMAMLDKRLKRMEERVIKIMPKDEQRNVDVIGRAVVKPALPGTATKPESRKRVADQAFGDELDSWSKSNGASTGTKPPFKSDEKDVMLEGAEYLPSPEIQHHLAEVFFDHVYGQAYHLLHKPSYMRKLEAEQLPPVLVLSVCSLAARFSSHPDLRSEPAFLRGETWAKAARELALKRYDTPNITILICYLLLGLHEFGACQGGRSWMLGGMAQRMAYALQLHKDLDHAPSSGGEKNNLTCTDREIRRRTMWACYIMDRFNSSGTDRPMFVAESYIEAQLPIKEQYFQMEITGPTETLEGPARRTVLPDSGHVMDPKENMGVAAYMVRAVSIWGHVVRYVNLGGRDNDPVPMWSEKSGFSKLRASANEFKTTLPAQLQWSEENLQNHATVSTGNQFIFLHIVIHQINLFINRFALPVVGSKLMGASEMPSTFLSECARTALDAASQISTLVNQAHEHRVVAPFAGYSAFLSSTVHIHGLSSKNPAIEASSKQYLAWNVKYLSKMKKYWGMFYFVTEHLKDLYRRQIDANARAQQGIATPSGPKASEGIFQYGDWFAKYPHGVSGTDYDDSRQDVKKEAGADALFGQKADLQSVDEFFQKLSPQTRAAQARKATKKKSSKGGAQATADSPEASSPPPSAPGRPKQKRQRSTANATLQAGQLESDLGAANPPMNQDQSTLVPSADQMMYDPGVSIMQEGLGMMQEGLPQMQRPSIMSQLDRQMVLSSYGGAMDPINFSQDMDLQPDTFAAFGDLANVPPDAISGFDPTWGDPPTSLSWFMPFNVNPPDNMGDDSSLFGGQYDFGSLAGLGGFNDLSGGGGIDGNGPNEGV